MVYRRCDTNQQVYQARLKVPGVSGYVTLPEDAGFADRPHQAEDLFYELRAEQKLGMDVRVSGNLKFKDLWKCFYTAHKNGLSVHRQRRHKFMSEKYFTPISGMPASKTCPTPSSSNIGIGGSTITIPRERRPSFDEAEWKKVYTFLREWVKDDAPQKNLQCLVRNAPLFRDALTGDPQQPSLATVACYGLVCARKGRATR